MPEKLDRFEPVLSIGVVAKKLNIAVQTVRLYEQEGLIIPHKTATNRRLYSVHDLERLHCIRKMITENGINIQGIKRIMSFIPCWEFKGGLDEECRNCPAYYEANGPCWNMVGVGKKCEREDCRSCPVYRLEFNCTKMKQVIYGHHREDNI